jgi:hypothetical protein
MNYIFYGGMIGLAAFVGMVIFAVRETLRNLQPQRQVRDEKLLVDR